MPDEFATARQEQNRDAPTPEPSAWRQRSGACLMASSMAAGVLAMFAFALPTTAFAATPDAKASELPAANPQTGSPASSQPERPAPPPPPVNYVCDDGTKIVARFPDAEFALLNIGADRYELRIAISASGARYTGGQVEFWTHQGTARFTRGDKTTECRPEAADATPAEPAPPTPTPAAPGK